VCDGVDYAVEVAVDAASEGDESVDLAAFRGGDPPLQVGGGVGGCGGSVEVAELFFELPGAPEAAVADAELVDDRVAGVVEVLGGGAQGATDPPQKFRTNG
jgi:hypothetical protein